MTILDSVLTFRDWKGQQLKERSINGYYRNLLHFCLFLRDPMADVQTIKYKDCEEWFKLNTVLGYEHNTIIKLRIALKEYFKCLRLHEIKSVNPDLILIPNKQFKIPRVATSEDYKKLLEAVPRNTPKGIRDRALIMMYYDTGARNDEVASLKITDLNFERKSAGINTEKSKGMEPFREIFWTDETDKAIREWLSVRKKYVEEEAIMETGYLFIGIKKGFARGIKGDKLMPSYISEIMQKYSNKAGLKTPCNPHAYRHLFGRDMGLAGAEDTQISSLLGHASVQSSYPYTRLFGKRREDLYRRTRVRG